MFDLLFGLGGNKLKKLLRNGAVIIDVRPAHAFDGRGRIPDSINIPMDRLPINLERIKSMNRPIIICCEYGNDCSQAARLLKEKGVKEVYNGGNWQTLYRKL